MQRVFALGSRAAESRVVESLRAHFTAADGLPSHRSVTYHDTFDWRLLRDQGTLESWADGGASVVAWQSIERGLLHRLIGQPMPAFARDLAPGPFRRALEVRIAARRLLPQVRIDLRSRTLRFLDSNQKTVARAVFERGSAWPIGGSTASRRLPATVTVDAVRGYDDFGARVAAFLETRLALPPAPQSALIRALAALGRAPAAVEDRGRLKLAPDMTVGEALRQILHVLLEAIRRNEAGVRGDLDSEFLHDFRVAVRRTRSAVGSIEGAFCGERFDHFRNELEWIGGLTGPVRDLDVFLLDLSQYREMLPADVRSELEQLEASLRERRRLEHGQLVATLASERWAALLRDWPAFLDGGEQAGPRSEGRLLDAASEHLRQAFKRVIRRGRTIDATSPAPVLHRLRIACKKLRYAIEFFSDLYPAEHVDRLVDRLKRLQDHLGRFNDLEIQLRTLREIAGSPTPPALDLLSAHLLAAQRTELDLVQQRFARFDSRKNRERMRTLFAPRIEP